jgi:hypothetical protein
MPLRHWDSGWCGCTLFVIKAAGLDGDQDCRSHQRNVQMFDLLVRLTRSLSWLDRRRNVASDPLEAESWALSDVGLSRPEILRVLHAGAHAERMPNP